MAIEKGDWVDTPRFLKVKIAEVFENEETAREQGFCEPTHCHGDYKIYGKHIGTNMMIFAVVN